MKAIVSAELRKLLAVIATRDEIRKVIQGGKSDLAVVKGVTREEPVMKEIKED